MNPTPIDAETIARAKKVAALTAVFRAAGVSADDLERERSEEAWTRALRMAEVRSGKASHKTRAAVISALRQLQHDTEESVWTRL